jgi:hypothetical protein
MYKLANQVLDAYDDSQMLHLRKIARLNPNIYMMTSDEHSAVKDFALSIITKKANQLNRFPIDTHDNTWLSNHYFNETHYRMPKEAAQVAAHFIKQACVKHKIAPTPSVSSMAKEANSNIFYEKDMPASARVERTATPDLSKFAEVQKISDNYTHAQYVFASPGHVKLATRYFEEFCDKMPMEYRHKYAAAIQMRAGELGMGKQRGRVEKYASDAYSAHVDAHVRSRMTLLTDENRDLLNKLASAKTTSTPMDFARMLHGFDKHAKLDKYYGGYLTNPYEATFATQVNENARTIFKSASYGNLSPDAISKVATEKYAKIKEYFGSSIADTLKKEGAPIFESLPNDAKEIIAGIADGSL